MCASHLFFNLDQFVRSFIHSFIRSFIHSSVQSWNVLVNKSRWQWQQTMEETTVATTATTIFRAKNFFEWEETFALSENVPSVRRDPDFFRNNPWTFISLSLLAMVLNHWNSSFPFSVQPMFVHINKKPDATRRERVKWRGGGGEKGVEDNERRGEELETSVAEGCDEKRAWRNEREAPILSSSFSLLIKKTKEKGSRHKLSRSRSHDRSKSRSRRKRGNLDRRRRDGRRDRERERTYRYCCCRCGHRCFLHCFLHCLLPLSPGFVNKHVSRLNGWMNERMNEWMNEWTNKLI